MEYKAWIEMLMKPSHVMLRMRDRMNLLLLSVVLSLLLLLLIAANAERCFDMTGDEVMETYGIAISVANTISAFFYLRRPLRKIGFLEHV